MSDSQEPFTTREQRLNEVLAACLEEIDAGKPLNQSDFQARYPEFASELKAFFAAQGYLDHLAEPLRQQHCDSLVTTEEFHAGARETPVENDPDALIRLLRQHGPTVRGLIRGEIPRQFRSLLSEDDIMQESYAEAFLSFGQFDLANSFPAWLQRIAKNNLLDAIKGLRAHCRGGNHRRIETERRADGMLSLFDSLSDSGTTPSRGAMRGELADAVREALAQLPDAYREVVRLYDLECRNAEQVAQMLDCSLGAVFMRRARALEMLREILGAFSDFV